MNAVEAREATRKGSLDIFQQDIKDLIKAIESAAKLGQSELKYDVRCWDRVNLLIAHFEGLGYNVTRYRFFHSGYETIKVKW